MNIARLAMKRPVTTMMFFISLVVVGLISSQKLPLEYFPELDAPFIAVNVPYQGSAPKEIEREITRPVEEALSTVHGVKQIFSETRADNAQIFMIFDWGVDLAIKVAEVRERVENTRSEMPADVRRINVFKFSTADDPILRVRLSSSDDNFDLRGQYNKLQRLVKRPLERVSGIARVDLSGVAPEEVHIDLRPERVASHSVDINALAQMLQSENFSMSGGLINHGDMRLRVQPEGEFRTLEQIGDLIVTDAGVRLRDIADVRFQPQELDYRRILDGNYAVGIDVFKERGANLVETGRAVRTEVERINTSGDLGDLHLILFNDRAEGVKSSLRELFNSGLLGMGLSLLVLYAFLRHWPSTLMVSLAVPVSLTITLGGMYFAGLSLNILSMMGLLLAVGMLVDNAVVVVESIFQERDKPGTSATEAAAIGAGAVTLAVTAGTMTTVIVFLPIIFGGLTDVSIFLFHVAVPVTISMLSSWLVAVTLIPMLAARIKLPKRRVKAERFEHLRNAYGRFLEWTLAHRWKSVTGIVVMLALTVVPYNVVNFDLFPADDSRTIRLSYDLLGTYRLDELEPAVRTVVDYLEEHREQWEIKSIYSYFSETQGMATWIQLRDDADATLTSSEVTDMLRPGLPKLAIGEVKVQQGPDDDGSGNEGVSLSLIGDSTEVLEELSRSLMTVLADVDGLIDVRVDGGNVESEVQLKVDRERVAALGMDAQQVADVVSTGMRGLPLREFRSSSGEVPMWLRFKDSENINMDQLGQIQLTRPDGESIPLSAVVSMDVTQGPASISRQDRQVSLAIQANLDDIGMPEARKRISEALEPLALPAGYRWAFGRGFDRDQEAQSEMMFNFLFALALIYLVMAALFESPLYPLTILTSIVFSICGVFWAFMLTGTTFSLTATIGVLILMGVVVNNGIVLIEHVNNLRRSGMLRDQALATGGRERLRPILMTVGTTVLGLMPLCISQVQIGGDGPPYYPMARAIAGGLLFSTGVSLIVLPSIYAIVDDFSNWIMRVHREAWGRLVGDRKSATIADVQ